MPLLASRGLSIGPKGRLYSASARSVMLYGSEPCLIKEEDVIRLERNVARMVIWMCSVRTEDTISTEEFKTRQKFNSMRKYLQDRRL